MLRRRLQDSPRQVRVLEERLLETKGQLAQALSQNERLAATLGEAREQIIALKEEVEKLTAPPSGFGSISRRQRRRHHQHLLRQAQAAGQRPPRHRPQVAPARPGADAQRGPQRGRGLHLVQGEVVQLKEMLGVDRALVIGNADEERVVQIGEPLHRRTLRAEGLAAAGRPLRVRARAPTQAGGRGSSWRRCPTSPTRTSAASATRSSRSATPSSCRSPARRPVRRAPAQAAQGHPALRPPGCGKTLIAKAVASSLAKKVAEVTGRTSGRSYFLNIKGPELLNKYVGETGAPDPADLPAGRRSPTRACR